MPFPPQSMPMPAPSPMQAQDQFSMPLDNPMQKPEIAPEAGIDPSQLKLGIIHESEHGLDEATTKKIAMDHLKEIPDYYTRLKEMEAEAKGGKEGEKEEGEEE